VEKMPSNKPIKRRSEVLANTSCCEKTPGTKHLGVNGLPTQVEISTSIYDSLSTGLPFHVACWGITDSHWAAVCQTCAKCGASVNRLTCLKQVHDFSRDHQHSSAIVALDEPPADTCFTVASIFKSADIKVIAYKDFLNSWPIGMKCRALLAGAGHLIDSSTIEFGEKLFSCLEALLATRREEISEAKNLQEIALARGIVGNSESLLSALRQLVRASKLSDLPLLISGESGTGKELFASALHVLDPKRNNKPFISVNCAAISAGVADSELFGHVKGAFTSASHDHNGFFLAAQNGILFLDEIGELSLEVQAKLLRALQEKRFFQVGSAQETAVDIRVVAATNRNLMEWVKQGHFREDLYHRLNALSVRIDPLRERTSDLPLLINHIVTSHKSWCGNVVVEAEVVEALSHLELKGNMRELGNLITAALTARANQSILGIADLPSEVLEQLFDADSWRSKEHPHIPDSVNATDEKHKLGVNTHCSGQDLNLKKCLNQREHEVLLAALQHTHHNQTAAARLLGITPRNMYNKLRKFDMLSRLKT
jgi:transcriptional regulator with GAF, ATPase, and Fis domain